jgi:hypothetical protein
MKTVVLSLVLWMRDWLRWEAVALEKSYVVKIAITEQSSTTSNHRPETFPSAFLGPRDAASTFDVAFSRLIIAIGHLLGGRSHDECCRHQSIRGCRPNCRNVNQTKAWNEPLDVQRFANRKRSDSTNGDHPSYLLLAPLTSS